MMGIYSYPATILSPHRTQCLLLAAVLIPTIVCAADFTGRVVGVIDGDTIEVLHNQRPERIPSAGSIARRKAKPGDQVKTTS